MDKKESLTMIEVLLFFFRYNRHEWYQNDSYVTISVFIKNVKKESVDINITENAVRISNVNSLIRSRNVGINGTAMDHRDRKSVV